MSHPTRREIVQGSLAGALALTSCGGSDKSRDSTWPPAPTPRSPEPATPWDGRGAEDGAGFPLGVQAGDPAPDGAVLWTRYIGTDALSLVIAQWTRGGWEEVATLDVTTGPDGYTHTRVEGHLADAALAYQFEDARGSRSPVGHFRTATEEGHDGVVRFAASSCFDQDHVEFPCLDRVQEVGPVDFFLWLGDTVYADASGSLEDFREVWATNLTTETFRALLGATCSVYTWDDHEVGNNWDPQTIATTRRDTAFQAFFETIPFKSEAPPRLWRSFRYGRAVEVFVLDVRSERNRAAGEFVSRAQLDWLKDGLVRSTAVWKIIANSVPITDMPAPWDVLDAHLDRWEGFGPQREELLDHIVDRDLRGVVFVSGDLHQTTLNRVAPDGPHARILEIMTGPGGSFLNVAARLLGDDEQFLYTDAEWSATWFECRADGTAVVIAVNEEGTVLFRATINVDGDVVLEDVTHPWMYE